MKTSSIETRVRVISPPKGVAEVNRRVTETLKLRSTVLNLSSLELRNIPKSIEKLRLIVSLDLSENPLKEIPEWISRFAEMRTLIISGANLPSFPEPIRCLKRLKKLSIVSSGLTLLPDWIDELKNLTYLSLADNPIKELPETVGNLHRLVGLNCDRCELLCLPSSIQDLSGLKELYIRGNPFLGIPEDIGASRSSEAILSYYSRINPRTTARWQQSTSEPLNEFKLVLVGRGGVGKTSLVHKLITGRFKTFRRTDGITINEWPLKCASDDVRAHIWDFGGQEIMHGTHRLFITSRSLYLILLSAREGMEDADADYWISLVRSLAGEVPIIVVLNKFKEFPFELNRRLLKDKFGGNIHFVSCDAKSNFGIDEIKAVISERANSMPELRKVFPKEWVAIKNELPRLKQDWMSFESFVEFCRQFGENKRRACEQLAGYLHDLGLMLSYRHDSTLRNFGVLNPHWVTSGIYKIITAQEFRDRGGNLGITDFAKILPRERYPVKIHGYLLALMRRFELCFPLDDSADRYLVPELLTKEEPAIVSGFDFKDCL